MKDYYDILEIDKDADDKEIKGAYFKLVRKYTPERFPEEFKQIRAAYETLSDADMRAEYDLMGGLPYEAAFLYGEVQRARREHRESDATDILKTIVSMFPELLNMKVELARSYEYELKTGNAIKVWEELCAQDPKNSFYSYELALSYRDRGWRKKAIVRFERTVALDPNDAMAWVELIGCYDDAYEYEQSELVLHRALDAVKENREGIVELYSLAFDLKIDADDKEAAEGFLIKIVDVFRNDEQRLHITSCMEIASLLNTITFMNQKEFLPYIQQMAECFPGLEDQLLASVKSARMTIEIGLLEEEGFSPVFEDLLNLVLEGARDQDDKNDIICLEASILYDLRGYRPYLIRLKKEHPDLYDIHSAFFNEALLTREREKLLYRRVDKLAKYGLAPNFMFADGRYEGGSGGDDGTDEGDGEWAAPVTTYRREGPKIGRNDTCPCGSGKKYKKCCGA